MVVNKFPWPPKELSPNSRLFWRARNPIKSAYREQGFCVTEGSLEDTHRIRCDIVFNPPDKRHRDLDNLLASCKPLIDGMCQKLKVNDKNLSPISIDWGEVVKGGEVVISLSG